MEDYVSKNMRKRKTPEQGGIKSQNPNRLEEHVSRNILNRKTPEQEGD